MANEYLQERLRTALNQELIRRLMIRYFVQKGFTEAGSFNKKIYPPTLQDLGMQIPQLIGKVEVDTAVEDIDPRTGITKLCWNLFVLGNQRMFLGFSTHTNLSEVRTAIQGPLSAIHRGSFATPKRIVNFITQILGKSENGDIASMPKNITIRPGMLPLGTGEVSGYFRTSHRPVF
jgi:hypothetical protein